jgi:hypothetical protein
MALAVIILSMPVAMLAQNVNFKISPERARAVSQVKLTPGQTAVVKDAESLLPAANRPCENFAWAAVMETLTKAAAPEVGLTQGQLSLRAFSGDRCVDSVNDYDALNRFVEGEYALGEGRHVRLTATYISGGPSNVDSLIMAFRAGQPALFIWNNHPYLMYGIVYDERSRITGDREFLMREILLLDPAKPVNHPDHKLSFVNGRDDVATIGGVVTLHAEPF